MFIAKLFSLPFYGTFCLDVYLLQIYIYIYVNGKINIFFNLHIFKIRDTSVGIALGYGLDDRGSRVRFPAGAGNFSLHHRVQNGSGAHPTFYPMDTRGSFPGGKATGA
jgi:hypothetical protein